MLLGGDDGNAASEVLVDRCAAFISSPPSLEWNGVEVLQQKVSIDSF
jgi:hypothetical protein